MAYSKKEIEETFDKMLLTVPEVMDTSNFAFSCSKNMQTDITEHKGYPVDYFQIIQDDHVYFMTTPNF